MAPHNPLPIWQIDTPPWSIGKLIGKEIDSVCLHTTSLRSNDSPLDPCCGDRSVCQRAQPRGGKYGPQTVPRIEECFTSSFADYREQAMIALPGRQDGRCQVCGFIEAGEAPAGHRGESNDNLLQARS